MLSKAIEQKLNEQLNREIYSAYLYLAMAAYCDAQNLAGFAHWMRKQSEEEWGHAMKFYSFINDREGRVVLEGVPKPPEDYESPVKVFEAVLEHEQKISRAIHELYELAQKENDYATQGFLNWFVEEQVEEEKSAREILQALRMVGEKGQALFMVDRHLAQR